MIPCTDGEGEHHKGKGLGRERARSKTPHQVLSRKFIAMKCRSQRAARHPVKKAGKCM